MSNTVIIQGNPVAIHEHVSDEALSPGHMLQWRDQAGVEKLTAAGNNRRAVALENSFGGDINTAYAANDSVRYGVFPPGAVVNLRVRSGATAIEKFAKLTAHSDGTVKGGTSGVIGYALEALASPSAETFIKVELA